MPFRNEIPATAMLRPLRIAVSVVSGLCCVLLVVLWVRSWGVQSVSANWYGDEWKHKVAGERYYKVFSNRGAIRLHTASYSAGWSMPVLEDERAVLGFGVLKEPTSLYVRIPYWFPVALCVFMVPAPWFSWSRRFSLRTLLITTTIIALVLGLIIYATQS